jgi:hypothetical protein
MPLRIPDCQVGGKAKVQNIFVQQQEDLRFLNHSLPDLQDTLIE